MSKWTNEEIASKVESEGLGYVIQSYLSSKDISDEWLAERWRECKKLMKEIDKYLEPYFEEEE